MRPFTNASRKHSADRDSISRPKLGVSEEARRRDLDGRLYQHLAGTKWSVWKVLCRRPTRHRIRFKSANEGIFLFRDSGIAEGSARSRNARDAPHDHFNFLQRKYRQ